MRKPCHDSVIRIREDEHASCHTIHWSDVIISKIANKVENKIMVAMEVLQLQTVD
jgi:hypothetical protein